MDQVWNRGDFEEFLHPKDQQQQVDQLDLSCMINDFLPNEQYPYNMEFQESLAELSPESQILLEDAVSMGSSQSPLSDDYSSCTISAQNSPLSNGEEYLYNNSISFDVKKEKISPKNSLVDMIGNTSFDDLLLNQQQPNLIPTLQEINIEKNDFQVYLEPPAKKTPDRFSGFMPQQLKLEEKATEGFRFSVNDNQGIKFTNGNADSCLAQVLQEASEKGMFQGQKQNVVELLKKNYANEMQKGKKQSQNKEPKAKKASKKQKKEQQNGQKIAQADNLKEQNPALEETASAKSQTDASKTLPQVVMIPQVVFTNGNCQTVTTQPAVTAYLASSYKTTMTALPIKIVSANSSEVDKIPINPLGKRNSETMISKKAEKGERKTNHNEVEKRYRKSITSNLEELKDLVFGSETRSTKAGILRKAMEHIKHLRKINQRLKQENMQLKMAQKQTSLVDLVKNNMNTNNVMQTSTEDFNEPFSSEDDDLPMSEEDDALSVGADSESKSESPPSIESVQGSAFSMMNKQRFFLSMFMFAFMFLGPSKLLFGSINKGSSVDYTSPHAGGRTILSVDTSEEDGFRGYTKLIVNCILYLLFFAWLLIKGEPRYPRSCKQLSLFKTFLKKADNEMKQGDFTTASVYIERGLQVIGRPLSLSKTDMIPSLFWHSLCHMLHQLGILPMLKYLGWLILPRRLSLNEAVHKYRASCLLAAEAYSKLLDLSLLDPEKRKNSLLCAKLSMAAINMAENAESLAGNELLTKVYINTVALLRMKIGKPAYLFMNFYINRAKSAFSGYTNDTPRALNWILNPAGKSYILSGDWDLSYKKNSFKDPLRMIGYQYLMYQVKMTLKHIMAPTAPVVNVQGTENELSILKQLSQDGDSVAKWWYSVVAPIFYIQYGMKDKAKQAWNTELMCLSPESNPLACDLYDIVECYFNIDDGIEKEELEEKLQIAEDHLLRNFIFEQGKGSKDELFELLAYACAEMALIVRVEHWETSNSGAISVEQLTKFEQDLNILKELSNRTMVSHKVEHYNKILRVMVGSNPIHLTKQLLAKKKRLQIKDNGPDKRPVDVEEIQEAKTLLFVFKHLSDVISKCCPKGYISHLQNAGLALERCGMLEMTEDCKKLLATLQTT